MRSMKRLYFGHPINVYGTALQRKLLKTIENMFPAWEIENPDKIKHHAGYDEYGMPYFIERVLPLCSGGVFLPFRDGHIGSGVFMEMEALFLDKKPVWLISDTGKTTLRLISLDQIEFMVLTREATKARVRLPY